MKRSKIFLGITTGVLAVVAFTAAKTAKYSHSARGYYSVTQNKCTVPANQSFLTTGTNQATADGNLVFRYVDGPCATKLYTGSAD